MLPRAHLDLTFSLPCEPFLGGIRLDGYHRNQPLHYHLQVAISCFFGGSLWALNTLQILSGGSFQFLVLYVGVVSVKNWFHIRYYFVDKLSVCFVFIGCGFVYLLCKYLKLSDESIKTISHGLKLFIILFQFIFLIAFRVFLFSMNLFFVIFSFNRAGFFL